MLRDTNEKAHSFRGQYNPDNSLIDFDFVVGYIDKGVIEQNELGDSFVFINNNENPIGRFQYDIWNINIKNVSQIDFLNSSSRWTYGIQATREKRISKQERDGALIEYSNQPSGTKETEAIYGDFVLNIDKWRFQLGFRHDKYSVFSEDDRISNFTKIRFGDEKIRFSKTTPSFSIDYEFDELTIFYRQSEAFRAPLVTQYFAPSYTNASDNYKVIVPVSGGKDGSYIAHKLKSDYGVEPLCVTVRPPLETKIGQENVYNFVSSGFSHVHVSPDEEAMAALNKYGFIEKGFPYYGWLICIHTAVLQIAKRFNIGLIFYAEDGEIEYGGSTEKKFQATYDVSYQRKVYLEGGYEKVLEKAKLDESKLFWFKFQISCNFE